MHSAKSLFTQNIQSCQDCLNLYNGLNTLTTTHNLDWLLRAGVVFIVSALDTYFHDKIKYNVGKFKISKLPNQLGNFEISLSQIEEYTKAKRKGNVIRNWIVEYLSVRPIQRVDSIAEYLKLIGIENYWQTIEPDKTKCKKIKDEFKELVKRRNEIAHEGDRLTSRQSGKKLRNITDTMVSNWKKFAEDIVDRTEKKFKE